jgi:hypothetical protein
MNILLGLVKTMHKKFNITSDEVIFTSEEKNFRIACLQEELNEYKEATNKEDELDSLIDLIVFALGTVERQNFTKIFDEAFQRVMNANCQKEIGENKKRGSFSLDLVKPEGWKAPNFKDLFEQHNL